MTPEAAIGIGQDALIWLAGQPDDLARFLEASGVAPESLRERAADPEFLGFVLDFMLGSDATVLDFARAAGLAPDAPSRARAALGGGPVPSWT